MKSLRPLVFLLLLPILACEDCDNYGPTFAQDACLSCHDGIEAVHTPYVPEGRCVVCHGGDDNARQKDRAHVSVPEDWETIRGGLPPSPVGFIKDFAPDQLDALDPAYLRFINPGDTRVVAESCGVCHEEQVQAMPNSVMATNVGHYFPTLYLAGMQDDQTPLYASGPATDPACDPSVPGTVCELEPLRPLNHDEVAALFAQGVPAEAELLDFAYRSYLAKNCNTCHQAGYPKNNSPGLYRSTGCSSCHFVYGAQGNYEGGDPTLARGTPVHPERHEITTAIPSRHCASCHFQGGRIGLLYRGIREGGFGSNSPPNAVPVPGTQYGHSAGYYFSDEDSTNDVDETPPDLHFAAGMDCVDCHVGRDVHGDGRLYTSSKEQVTLRCEDCHGDVREPARPAADGRFVSYKGNHLKQLEFDAANEQVVLTTQRDGSRLVVPQPSELLAPGGAATDAMREAMAPDGDDWSHADSLTCDTCHTSHVQYCIGCHVSVDLRRTQTDYQTGTSTPGLTSGSRSTYTLDHLLLGTAPDGRVQTTHPSQQLQMVVRGAEEYGTEDGELLHGQWLDDGEGGETAVGRFRRAQGSDANNGFVPFFQHTTSPVGRPCRDCHRERESDEENARIRGVYGFGTGEFLLRGDEGEWIDGLQFLDADGNPTTTWHHPATGPVAPDVRQRAWDVVLESL